MAAERKGKRRTIRTASAVLLSTALAATGSLDSRWTAEGKTFAAEAAKLGTIAIPAASEPADRMNKAARTSASRKAAAVSALSEASFLEETGIAAAWKLLRRDVTGTIAIVDTGGRSEERGAPAVSDRRRQSAGRGQAAAGRQRARHGGRRRHRRRGRGCEERERRGGLENEADAD
ncbi:hypothetical protein [Cohnella rhizosphaerae]|uniref:hypothetical protein n=1 Tax=Cohnella rhizosphaerae TaxID=1457232 RepID=UPI0030B8D482